VAASISVDGNMIVSGISTFNNDVKLPDNKKIVLGASSDLEIYHDGSGSAILNNNNTQLTISSDNALNLTSRTGQEYFFRGYTGGAAELYHDNSKKLETASGGVTVTGTVAATSFSGSGANLTNLPGVTIGSPVSFGTGTTKDITIDSTNLYKVEIIFYDVSCGGGTDWQFQLGDSGGIETSGYTCASLYVSNASYAASSYRTDGFRWRGVSDSSFQMDGKFTLTRYDGNRWLGNGTLNRHDSADGTIYFMNGMKELSAALTTIRLMAASDLSESFDGGFYKLITHSS